MPSGYSRFPGGETPIEREKKWEYECLPVDPSRMVTENLHHCGVNPEFAFRFVVGLHTVPVV